MSQWLDFEQTFDNGQEVIFINLSQFDKKQATLKMHCRYCQKIVNYPRRRAAI